MDCRREMTTPSRPVTRGTEFEKEQRGGQWTSNGSKRRDGIGRGLGTEGENAGIAVEVPTGVSVRASGLAFGMSCAGNTTVARSH